MSPVITMLVFVAIALAVIVFILPRGRRVKKNPAGSVTNPVTPGQTKSLRSSSPVKSGVIATKEVPMFFGGIPLAYFYEKREIAMSNMHVEDYFQINPGDDLLFAPEPKNPHDPGAIQIILEKDHSLLGYVYRGKMQDMVRDWINRQEPFKAYISEVDETHKLLLYNIAFYKPGSLAFVKKAGDAKSGRLTRTSSKAAQAIIETLQVGEELDLEYDHDKEGYSVLAGSDLIGALPKSLSTFVRGDSRIFVEDIQENTDGKNIVTAVIINPKG